MLRQFAGMFSGGIEVADLNMENGLYDFPQKNYKSRIMNSTMPLLSRVPSGRKEIYTRRKNRNDQASAKGAGERIEQKALTGFMTGGSA
jgi:hypothetical protein